MLSINKGDILVLSNSSGGRAAIQVNGSFSSRVLYEQVATNGGLDLSKKEGNILKRSELEHYQVAQCDSIEHARKAVQETDEKKLKGYCNILNHR